MTKSEAFNELKFAADHFTGRISRTLQHEIEQMSQCSASTADIATMFDRVADEVDGNAGAGAVQRLRDVADALKATS